MDAKAAALVARSLLRKLECSMEDKSHGRLLTLFRRKKKWHIGINRDLSSDIAPGLVLVLLADEQLPDEVVTEIKRIRREIKTLRISDEVMVASPVFVAHLRGGVVECVTEKQDGAIQIMTVNVPARSLSVARKRFVGN